jgi:hypothetical protein
MKTRLKAGFFALMGPVARTLHIRRTGREGS